MSDQDDLYGVTQPPISDDQAERLLSGSNSDLDAAAMAGLEAVLNALRAPADPSEVSGMDATIAAFQGAVVVTPFAGPSTARTRPMRKNLLTAKAIATIGAVTLMSAGAAAAATGTVPSPFASDQAKEVTAERVPDIALGNVGKHTEDTPTVTETTAAPNGAVVVAGAVGEAIGPDATGAAKFGLCTAYAAHVEHRDADAAPTTSLDMPAPFRNLTDAAATAGQSVEEFCEDATPGDSESAPGLTGEGRSATAPGQTGDNPSSSAPGQTGDNPSVTAVGRDDDNPSASAPASGSEDNPSATAPGRQP